MRKSAWHTMQYKKFLKRMDVSLKNIKDILDGTAELNLSHAGGEFQLIMEEELYQQHSYDFSLIMFVLYFKFIIRCPPLIHISPKPYCSVL